MDSHQMKHPWRALIEGAGAAGAENSSLLTDNFSLNPKTDLENMKEVKTPFW